MVSLISVLTFVGELCPAVAVVARLTETFCIERFFDVWASKDFFKFTLFFLASLFPMVYINRHLMSVCLIVVLLFFICAIVGVIRNAKLAQNFLLGVDFFSFVRLYDKLLLVVNTVLHNWLQRWLLHSL